MTTIKKNIKTQKSKNSIKKSHIANHSTKIHARKPRTYSHASSRTFAKPLIISVIIVTILVVIVALFCGLLFTPENQVKNTISRLTTDYYENYFYEKYTSASYDTTAIQKYADQGVAPIYLRQLLLYDNQKNAEYKDLLAKYCDEDKTYAIVYPDPPYNKKSYHLEFTYSCNF